MEDRSIVDLYWARDEEAIAASRDKYGAYCGAIARNILTDAEDVPECVNDTWLGAWNAIPPQRPDFLGAFLGRITRNLSLKRWRRQTAQKRGGGEVPLALEELSRALPAGEDPAAVYESKEVAQSIDRFLRGLPKLVRQLFLRRYWYLESIAGIADSLGYGESRVKMSLLRTRKKLKQYLEQEGIVV